MTCPDILKVEIGKGNFYTPVEPPTITRTRDGKADKAAVKIEIPRNATLIPSSGPWKCAIIDARRDRVFGGELYDRNITDDQVEDGIVLDLQIDGFFGFTQRKKIRRYSNKTRIESHVAALLQASGANEGSYPALLGSQVFTGVPDPRLSDLVNFIIDQDKYLHEALDQLAAEQGYSWEIADNVGWTEISDIGPPTGQATYATIIFRKNSLEAVLAPKPIFRKPRQGETPCLDDVFWEGEDRLNEIKPRINKLTVFGRNGDLAVDDNFPTEITDWIMRDLPKKPVALRYSYPETATMLVFGMLSSKLPDDMNPNGSTPCGDIIGMNITFAGAFIPTASGNTTLALFADRDINDGTGTVAGTASYFFDLTNVNLTGRTITAPFRVFFAADIRVFGSAFASPVIFRITLNKSGQQVFMETRTLTPDPVSGIARLEFVYNADLTSDIGGMLLISAVASLTIAPSNEPISPPALPGENIESSGQLNLSLETITCSAAPPQSE